MIQKKTLHAKIISPIHISTGYERGMLDTFVDQKQINFVDQEWIARAIQENKINKNQLLQCIKKGNFKELHEIKTNLGKDFFKIIASYPYGENAKKNIVQGGNSNNQGLIKKQYVHPFTDEAMIPGSTLKGILRTAYIYNYVEKNSISFTTLKNEQEGKKNELAKSIERKMNDIFKYIQVEDAEIENQEIKIQIFQSKNKPAKPGKPPKKGIALTVQSVICGEFDISLSILPNQSRVDLDNLEEKIKNYSKLLIGREEQIIDNINYGSDFLYTLDQYFQKGQYPIKIGMYKKSLAYKLFWKEMIDALPKGKKRLDESRKKGVGDKTLYVDEEGNPVGRIVLSF